MGLELAITPADGLDTWLGAGPHVGFASKRPKHSQKCCIWELRRPRHLTLGFKTSNGTVIQPCRIVFSQLGIPLVHHAMPGRSTTHVFGLADRFTVAVPRLGRGKHANTIATPPNLQQCPASPEYLYTNTLPTPIPNFCKAPT